MVYREKKEGAKRWQADAKGVHTLAWAAYLIPAYPLFVLIGSAFASLADATAAPDWLRHLVFTFMLAPLLTFLVVLTAGNTVRVICRRIPSMVWQLELDPLELRVVRADEEIHVPLDDDLRVHVYDADVLEIALFHADGASALLRLPPLPRGKLPEPIGDRLVTTPPDVAPAGPTLVFPRDGTSDAIIDALREVLTDLEGRG